MKKLLTLFAVFALTAPVFAADGDPNVLITCVDEGNAVVRVDYQVLAEDGFVPGDDLLRGIALDITTSNTATIAAISDYAADGFTPPVDSAGIDDVSGFIIYMGSIQFAADPNLVSSFGDPVAPNTDPGALAGLGNTGITIEMGTLYSDDGTPPPTSGTLFRLELDCGTETSTVLTIAGNTTRGGDLGEAVLESGALANVVSAGCSIECGVTECYVVGQPRYYDENGNPGPAITQANYDAWVLNGKPDCWCCPHHGYGDVNGDGFINANDIVPINNNLGTGPAPLPANLIHADVNHDGFINANDIVPVNNKLGTQLPTDCPGVCP